MLDYLSSELTHSAITPRARDLEQVHYFLLSSSTCTELTGLVQDREGQEARRQQEQDHIFSEIVKVGRILLASPAGSLPSLC